MPRVLIADDDRAIRESLARALELEGYDVVTVADGVEALTRSRRDAFDALVVDVMMPGVDGLAVCRVLRAEGDRTPVLMLTARVETPDRVAGLDAGADDYLSKPFELDELLARLRALLRRAAPVLATSGPDGSGRTDAALRIASLRVDPAARRVWWGDGELQLSKTEFDLLELWCATRASCWTTPRSTSGSGATTSAATRRTWRSTSATCAASSSAAGAPNLIHTVRGVGYAVRRAMSLRSRLRAGLRRSSARWSRGWSGVLSYGAASDRVTAEIDRSLRQVTTALANGQEEVLAPSVVARARPRTRPASRRRARRRTSSWSRSRWPPTAPSPRSAVDP